MSSSPARQEPSEMDPFVGIWEAKQTIVQSHHHIQRWRGFSTVVSAAVCVATAGHVSKVGGNPIRRAFVTAAAAPTSAAMSWLAVNFVGTRKSRATIRDARRHIRRHEDVLFTDGNEADALPASA